MAMTMAEQQEGYGPPTPVPIFQWEKEFEVLLELYRRLAPWRVLEVGTYHGGTLYHWLRNASPGTTTRSISDTGTGMPSTGSRIPMYPSSTPLANELISIGSIRR